MSSAGNIKGSAAFLANDRARQRTPEMELFNGGMNYMFLSTYASSYQNMVQARKPRSNFRRPSSLALSKAPVANKSEAKNAFQPKPSSRAHIVSPLKDHLKPEGSFESTSEVKANYRDHSPSRPMINKLKDNLKSFASFNGPIGYGGEYDETYDRMSEVKDRYRNPFPTRPILHRTPDQLHKYGGSLDDLTEFREHYINPYSSRPFIHKVADNLKNEGSVDDLTEVKDKYRNPNATRPAIRKLGDHLKPEGDFAKASETKASYNDLHPQRPIIHRLRDHSTEVQPEGRMEATTESSNYKKMSKGGEIAEPAWVSNFEKVTIE